MLNDCREAEAMTNGAKDVGRPCTADYITDAVSRRRYMPLRASTSDEFVTLLFALHFTDSRGESSGAARQ